MTWLRLLNKQMPYWFLPQPLPYLSLFINKKFRIFRFFVFVTPFDDVSLKSFACEVWTGCLLVIWARSRLINRQRGPDIFGFDLEVLYRFVSPYFNRWEFNDKSPKGLDGLSGRMVVWQSKDHLTVIFRKLFVNSREGMSAWLICGLSNISWKKELESDGKSKRQYEGIISSFPSPPWARCHFKFESWLYSYININMFVQAESKAAFSY